MVASFVAARHGACVPYPQVAQTDREAPDRTPTTPLLREEGRLEVRFHLRLTEESGGQGVRPRLAPSNLKRTWYHLPRIEVYRLILRRDA
jgi:hypothetical protein